MAKIYLSTSDEAHLADYRMRISMDNNPVAPWRDMDMVFTSYADDPPDSDDEVKHSFTVYGLGEFYTSEKRLFEYFDHDKSHWTEDAINSIAEEERKIFEAYCNGAVFLAVYERWDAAKRKFIEDSCATCYGVDDIPEVEDGCIACVDVDAAPFFLN